MNALPTAPVRSLFQPEYGHFIGGEWVAGSSGRKISLQNPADQSHLAYIQAGNGADADRAVHAAHEAFKSYSQSARARQPGDAVRNRPTPEAAHRRFRDAGDIQQRQADHRGAVFRPADG